MQTNAEHDSPIELYESDPGNPVVVNATQSTTPKPEPRDAAFENWIFTLPNIICMIRLIGSFIMFGFAVAGVRYVFVALFILLTISDWIDGRLARWFHQRSVFGARLDSFADAILYTSLVLGTFMLCSRELQQESTWFGLAVFSYVVTTSAGLIKYEKVPSYHTFAAKKTQVIVLIAGVLMVLQIAVWPVRIAAIAIILTNLEATLITLKLPTWKADVSSLWSVLKDKPIQE